ncbi:hypothetical protein F5J12DRAFT_746875 [Pisolithus orientalis]|uniref:uncharacterized protein n=1 Tax=Pisolithus orientalis TaxID=936130 RepID=UPI002224E674|nr:uncharacterized protein F5J12DRAFT_746875 [Pisolithus orientalis]KAI5994935.1 hypothetical protein F5J12DRAFT_746875 [Pisolithus orientalis]
MSTQEQPVLDSSPVQLPPISDFPTRRSLKRSASVASLPTPPRTRHKRSRGQIRSPTSRHVADESDSNSDWASSDNSAYATRITRVKSKSSGDEASQPLDVPVKRTALVLSSHDDDDEEETAFWMGGKRQDGEKAKKESEQGEPLESSPRPALLRYNFKGPVSPPPSRRQPRVPPNRATSIEPPTAAPSTPPRKLFLRAPPTLAKTPTRKTRKTWPRKLPTRDSPDNPFLNNDTGVPNKKGPSEWDCSDDEARELVLPKPVCKEGEPTPVSSYGERPTITYVFRGQKATMANPLYSVSPDAVAASRLPIDHPDYEPLEVCPPKRLFFSGGKRKTRDNSRDSIGFSEGVKRVRSHVSDSDGDSPQSGGEETKVDNKIVLPSDEDREPVFSKPPREPSQHRPDPEQESDAREALRRAREERERRVRADKERLGHSEGLRAGAVVTQRDDPIRRACGPPRNA